MKSRLSLAIRSGGSNMSVGAKTLSLVEFLKRPEIKPACEYIDGRVVRKMSPKFRHSRLQRRLEDAINDVAEPRKLGEAVPELRCTFAGRSLVFDVAFLRSDRIAYGPDGELIDDVFLAPDLAVDVLSPGQSVSRAVSRLGFCVKNGVRLAWLIDPDRGRVRVFRPGAKVVMLSDSDTLDGGDVLPTFRLPLKTVFGWLRREGNA